MLHGKPNQILRSLCLYLKKNTLRPISGIIGLEEMAQELIAEFKWNSNEFKLNHSEGLFKLELKDLKSRSLPDDLNLINLVDAPKPIIIEWMKAYEIEALAGTIDENLSSKAEEKYQQMLKLSAWVLLKNNLPVSLCGFNAQVEDICQLGPVWTPPEHRNLGYAKYCVGQALVQEKNKGYQHSLLFTENPAAEKVYITLGFKKFNRFCLAFLKKEMHVE